MMNLAVHVGSQRGLGSSIVGRHVIAELDRLDTVNVVALPLENPNGAVGARGPASKLFMEAFSIPRDARKVGADVLLSLGDTGPVRPGLPHVLLVQQAHLAVPTRDLAFTMGGVQRSRYLALRRYFRAGLRGVNSIIVQSEFMREQLLSTWELDPGRVHVIPTRFEEPPDKVSDRLPVDPPFVIYPARPAPHKNHAILPTTAARLRQLGTEIKFVLTIKEPQLPGMFKEARRLGIDDMFVAIGEQPRARVLDLLRSASATILPSLLESFGFGYYEAMHCDCPIVASDLPFAREACADAALYAPPHDGHAMGDALHEIIRDTRRRGLNIDAGRRRLREANLAAKDVGQDYLRVLSEAIHQHRVGH